MDAFYESCLAAVLGSAEEGMIVFDDAARCVGVGRRIAELFGLDAGRLVGHARRDVLGVLSARCEDAEAVFHEMVADRARVTGAAEAPFEIDLLHPAPRHLIWTRVPVRTAARRTGELVLVRDVTRERSAERQARQLEARLNEVSPIDPLTGLANQRRFWQELDREHGRAARAWDAYAVLRIDVDAMSRINAEYGVPVGDRVLEELASTVDGCRREYDLAARVGADEIALLLPGADGVAARTVAERIRRALAVARGPKENAPRVSVSIGASVWSPRRTVRDAAPPTNDGAEAMFVRAGKALATARTGGRSGLLVDDLAPSPAAS